MESFTPFEVVDRGEIRTIVSIEDLDFLKQRNPSDFIELKSQIEPRGFILSDMGRSLTIKVLPQVQAQSEPEPLEVQSIETLEVQSIEPKHAPIR